MKYFVIVGLIVAFILLWLRHEEKNKQARLEDTFSGRRSLTTEEFYEHYFKAKNISEHVVYGVKNILEEQLDADLSRLSDKDDFSKNLSFFWEFDSMADVEIVMALEEEFNIKIEDIEAEKTSTISDIVYLVWGKINEKA